MRLAPPEQGRVVIENVRPEVDGGRFAVKRIEGDLVRVEADVFADGHDELAARVLYRHQSETEWRESPMRPLGNDRWQAEFRVDRLGEYVYKLEAWVDRFATWRRDLRRREEAGQDLSAELLVGAELVSQAAAAAPPAEAEALRAHAAALEKPGRAAAKIAFDEELAALMAIHAPRAVSVHDAGQRIVVDREKARFSAWYELFPRSTSSIAGRHGTFKTCKDWLPYVQKMGFDVLYFPPIHPIGVTNRKGKNNNPVCEPGEPGSPWAIGGLEGGHDAVHPDLGTLEDFRSLVEAANARGIEVALDLALQCSPDHPWVREHPQWFRHRPDGSVRYAENPPKKYEDIYPLDFETEDWRSLWEEVERVVRFWIDQGVRIFRVDNPHTKPFAFWEWLICRIKADHPDVLFLSEAFTRPRAMYRLAKVGFSQSYTYFAWRNGKQELADYMTELTRTDVEEYFRPNFWPNTPDILHAYLQDGGRPAFVVRLVLAATMCSSYGIYGPAFELCLSEPREPGSEEYLNSEKYEIKHWDLDQAHSLSEIIARVNRIRRENLALQRNDTFRVLEVDNDQLLAFAKASEDGSNRMLIVVNLDPRNTQSGWVRVPEDGFGVVRGRPYELHDLMDGARYTWHGEWNYVELNPNVLPAHVLRLEWPPTAEGQSREGTA